MVSRHDPNAPLHPRSRFGAHDDALLFQRGGGGAGLPLRWSPRDELAGAADLLGPRGRSVCKGLGLASTPAAGLDDTIFQLLLDGRGSQLVRVLRTALVSDEIEPAALFDGPLRDALDRLRHLTDRGRDGSCEPAQATRLLVRVLEALDGLFEPSADEWVAVGACLGSATDPLTTQMGATVLASEGVYAIDLGRDTPASALVEVVDQACANIAWMNIDSVDDAARSSPKLERVIDRLTERGVIPVVSGIALGSLALRHDERVNVVRDLTELGRLARRLVSERTR